MFIPFISSAHAQAAAASGPNPLFQFGFLAVLFGVFYFVAIRPQQKRQKEHKNMLGSLAKGDEVATNAGILGKVTSIQDDYVVLKVADNTELKFQKFAVSAVLPKGTIKSVS